MLQLRTKSAPHLIAEQSLDKVSAQVLVVEVVGEEHEDLWGANVDVAVVQIRAQLHRLPPLEDGVVQPNVVAPPANWGTRRRAQLTGTN
jgi:hypothetical protein